jgi:hypothetical protein
MHIFSIRHEIDFHVETTNGLADAHNITDLNQKRIFALCNSLYIINIVVLNSVELSRAFANESDALKAHATLIGDEQFVAKNSTAQIKFWHHKKAIVDYLVQRTQLSTNRFVSFNFLHISVR